MGQEIEGLCLKVTTPILTLLHGTLALQRASLACQNFGVQCALYGRAGYYAQMLIVSYCVGCLL